MSEYMEQMAQNQIEAGLSERERLFEAIEKKELIIEKYKKALEFYADTKKWGVTCSDDLPDFQDADDNEELRNEDNERITIGGKTARQALSEVDNELF